MEKLKGNIKFSIVIPTYNRANLIKKTIESTLAQDYINFETIVVDDGSTDTTSAVVNAINDNRSFYYKKNNEERGAARNYGFHKATGQYVIFFDSDDIMHSNHLSTLFETITNLHEKVNFIATKYDFIRNHTIRQSSIYNLSEAWYSRDILLNGNVFACHFCIKKNNPRLHLFLEDRKYSIMEDWLFLMKNLSDDSIYVVDKVTISINDHDNRSMRGDNSLIIYKNLLAKEWIINNIPLTAKEKKILIANSYYFCAIHAYIHNNRKKALNYLKKGISENGSKKKDFILFVKILIGVKIVSKIVFFFNK
jgi:glycosyltransferase involved in cell wall biosynthesis